MMGGWSMIIEWKDSGFCIDAWSGGEGGKEGQQLGMWPCQEINELYPDQQLFWDHDGYPGNVGNMDTIYLGYSSDPVLCMDVAGGPNVDLSDPPLYQAVWPSKRTSATETTPRISNGRSQTRRGCPQEQQRTERVSPRA